MYLENVQYMLSILPVREMKIVCSLAVCEFCNFVYHKSDLMYSYLQIYGKSIEIESSNKIEIMMHTHGWQMARTGCRLIDQISVATYINM